MGETSANAAGATMRLARVIYTRVETRLNPDYQVLGFSPTAAALVSSRALDGFFHGLLGQPDTLTGFERACFFAPLFAPAGPASTGTVWVAGVARASDKPDRHGRTGILNFSVLLLTEAQAAQLDFDPWPLFDPAMSEQAFPFIDDPDARVADFEYTPSHSPEDETATPRYAPPESLAVALDAVHSNRALLLRARDEQTTARHLELAVHEVHAALSPEERPRVPLLTYSFRPATSAARLKLLAAPAHAPQSEEEWRRLLERTTFGSGATRATLDLYRQSTAAALQAAATLANATPDAAADAAGAYPHATPGRRASARRVVDHRLFRPVLIALFALGFVLGLWLFDKDSQVDNDNGEAAPDKTATRSNGDTEVEPPERREDPGMYGDPPLNDDPTGLEPRTLTAEALEAANAWRARWRASGLWPRGAEMPGAREEFAAVAEPFWQWLDASAPSDASTWPESLRRLAAEVALIGWRLDGRADSELGVGYRFSLSLGLAPQFSLHPIRMDYVLPGAVLPSRHWRITRELSVDLPADEWPRPHLSFAPGETGGELRVRANVNVPRASEPPSGPNQQESQASQAIEVSVRYEVPHVGTVLAADSPPRLALRDSHGRVALVMTLEQLYIEPTDATRRARFPDASIPVATD